MEAYLNRNIKEVIRAVTEVLLLGSLWREGQQFPTRQVQVELQRPTSLPDLLERLHIGSKQVQLAMVNYKAVPPDHIPS